MGKAMVGHRRHHHDARQPTASFKPFPALKRTVVDSGIAISSPVRGLRPVLAFRTAATKVPKPTSRTSSFCFSAPLMAPNTASTTSPALARERSVPSATAATRSNLFTVFPLNVEDHESKFFWASARKSGRTLLAGFPPRQCSDRGFLGKTGLAGGRMQDK